MAIRRHGRLCYNAAMSGQSKAPNQLLRALTHVATGPHAIALRWYDLFHRRSRGTPVWRLSAITPQLYVGGQHYKQGYRRMLDFGITAIVNMRREHCDREKGIAGERHLQLATIDNTPPSVKDLTRGVDFIGAEIARGGKVYIHCAVGCGRAPTMAAAWLIATGATPAEALTRIRRVRPFINPTGQQKSVLEDFAAAWTARPA